MLSYILIKNSDNNSIIAKEALINIRSIKQTFKIENNIIIPGIIINYTKEAASKILAEGVTSLTYFGNITIDFQNYY